MVCDFRALISPHIQICRSTVGIMSLRFNSDGTFRVLQMADIQDGPDVREDTIRLIEAAIRKAHPDLIVLTGDQIRGYDPAYIDTFLRRRGEQPVRTCARSPKSKRKSAASNVIRSPKH